MQAGLHLSSAAGNRVSLIRWRVVNFQRRHSRDKIPVEPTDWSFVSFEVERFGEKNG